MGNYHCKFWISQTTNRLVQWSRLHLKMKPCFKSRQSQPHSTIILQQHQPPLTPLWSFTERIVVTSIVRVRRRRRRDEFVTLSHLHNSRRITGCVFNRNANTIRAANVGTLRTLLQSKQRRCFSATVNAWGMTVPVLSQQKEMKKVPTGNSNDENPVLYDLYNQI